MISSSILKNGDAVFLNREKSEATKFAIVNDNMTPVIDRGQNNKSINRYFRMITDQTDILRSDVSNNVPSYINKSVE